MTRKNVKFNRNNKSKVNTSNSEFINSRLNLLDDQVTINYDLSHPKQHDNDNEEKLISSSLKKKKISKDHKFAQENNYKQLT